MTLALRRYRVNANFRRLRAGETVEIDPALWAPQITAGLLRPIDEPVPIPAGTDVGDAIGRVLGRGTPASGWDSTLAAEGG